MSVVTTHLELVRRTTHAKKKLQIFKLFLTDKKAKKARKTICSRSKQWIKLLSATSFLPIRMNKNRKLYPIANFAGWSEWGQWMQEDSCTVSVSWFQIFAGPKIFSRPPVHFQPTRFIGCPCLWPRQIQFHVGCGLASRPHCADNEAATFTVIRNIKIWVKTRKLKGSGKREETFNNIQSLEVNFKTPSVEKSITI